MPSRPNADPPAPRSEELLRHAPYLERLSRALSADQHDARDLVQETWTRALERPPRHGRNPRGWLAQILRRTHWRQARLDREARGPASVEDLVDERDPEAALERVDVETTLGVALGQLDRTAREVLRLRFFEDLPPRAIAARLGIPVSTVNTRLQRALGQLRARLDRRLGRGAWLAALLRRAPRHAVTAPEASSIRYVLAGVVVLVAAGTLVLLTRADARAIRAPESDGEWAARERSALPGITRALTDPSPGDTDARTPLGAGDPRLFVQVLEPSGRPVPGAEVCTFDLRTPPGSILRLGLADERGRLELDVESDLASPASDPLLGGRVGLMAAAADWTPSAMQYVLPTAGRATLVLGAPGRSVRGRVRSGDGRPIADARVEVGDYGALTEHDGVLQGALPRFGRTDEAGEFTVQQVSADVRVLRVTAEGWAAARAYVPDDARTPVEVVLERAGRVAGRVLDADGAPLAGAELWVLALDDPRAPTPVRSDAQAAFVIDGVAPGDCYAFARDPARPELCASRRITVRGGRESTWHPRLAPDPGLTVELVDERGAPLVDWQVNLASEDLLWLVGAVTDRAGRIGVHDLPEGNLSVSILGPRLGLGGTVVPRQTVGTVTRADSPLRVVVLDDSQPSARLSGLLVNARGSPHADARILIRRDVEAGEGEIAVDARSGHFSTIQIPPGAWLLRAQVEPLGSVDLGTHEVRLGQELDLGRIALPVPGALSFDWSGHPGDRVLVRHEVHGRLHLTRVLDAPPRRPLPSFPGEVRICFDREGQSYETSASVAPGGEAVVDLDALVR